MKKILAFLLAVCLISGVLAGCGAHDQAEASATSGTTAPAAEVLSAPKYVFLFIGDGMSYPQIQATADYLGALEDTDYFQAQPSRGNNGAKLDGPEYLNFMNFEAVGSAVTYDSNSFAPDSASSATSIATGHKTYAGIINMDENGLICYETIAEKVHEQLGMKVGVVSSVNVNHATPAAFYAHQPSRSNYYNIGVELVESGFEYFAGGAFRQPDGSSSSTPAKNLYTLAKAAGYTIARTNEAAESVSASDEKVIVIGEDLADSNTLAYELDRTEDMWSLADYVAKGIDVLDNENGFFMMCEGGKIDWACHANDAASAIHDTLALADAVQVAIDFAAEHPGETLILVTGDHETGGLSIGFAGTDYDTYLTLLQNQKISFAKYNSDYVAAYKKNGASFDEVLVDIQTLFGLKANGLPNDKLTLTDYEQEQLKMAYEKSVNGTDTGEDSQHEYVMYGTYEPLTVTITHILNNKSGINFSSFCHTGLPVAVFADGVNAEMFDGYYDNTEIYHKLAQMLNVT